MELDDIRKLAELMEDMGLSALEISENGKTVKLERKNTGTSNTLSSAAAPAEQETASAADANLPDPDAVVVAAPMVGVFYAAPSPDAKPFVSVGSKVKQGDVLCIIEAMKLMNEITAEQDGTICEVCVGNGQVVEYGHPLFRMKR